MSKTVLLNPEKVIATYDNFSHQLSIRASGREEGVKNIKIEETPMPIEPPVFTIVGEKSPVIGNFPFNAKANFNFLSNPEKIIIRTPVDDKEYPVGETASELDKIRLFPVSYTIETNRVGAPLFEMHFIVNTLKETVHGVGHITQATNPPLDVDTKLNGSFTYMTVMPDSTHILVTVTGYPIIQWPPDGGIGPVVLPNVELRMVLEKDWKSGTANYKYIDDNGKWQSIDNAKVQISISPALAS